MTALTLSIHPEHIQDAAPIERLHERAFGPGRFARTAFRLREGVPALAELSFTARVGTLLVGSIRLSPVTIGAESSALLLGPITIDPSFQGRGVGAALITRALAAARAAGWRLIILVGDAPYYARFGFTPVPPGRLAMPGPVDPGRLLWLDLVAGAGAQAAGAVRGGG